MNDKFSGDIRGDKLAVGDMMVDGRGRLLRFNGFLYESGELAMVTKFSYRRGAVVEGPHDTTRQYYCLKISGALVNELAQVAQNADAFRRGLMAWREESLRSNPPRMLTEEHIAKRAAYRAGLPR